MFEKFDNYMKSKGITSNLEYYNMIKFVFLFILHFALMISLKEKISEATYLKFDLFQMAVAPVLVLVLFHSFSINKVDLKYFYKTLLYYMLISLVLGFVGLRFLDYFFVLYFYVPYIITFVIAFLSIKSRK